MMPLYAKVAFLMAADAGGSPGGKPAGTALEVLTLVLDESVSALNAGDGLQIPDDELHREILVPLLPAMLGDRAIRQHWREQSASGFLARLAAHLEGDAHAPQWVAADFEIHVTASYLAGPDAKALADTLLSEESLREMTAELMNQILHVVWGRLPVAAPATPEPVAAVAAPTTEPAARATEEPELEPAAEAFVPAEELVPSAVEIEHEHGVSPWVTLLGDSAPPLPMMVRPAKPNPLRGTQHTFGGLGDRGWQARNPLTRQPMR